MAAKLVPGRFDLIDCSHVGHRAAGGHVGQDHVDALSVALGGFFGSIAQDVGRLGHEVNAAEDDGATLGAISRALAEQVAVAPQVRLSDHLVLLVVVAQDQ